MSREKQRTRKQFRRFFEALFRPEELVELRFIESWTSKGKRRSRVAAPAKWLSATEVVREYHELVRLAEAERANIYFGVCPRLHEGDSVDESIKTVRCLWCDIDDVTVEEARERWKAAGISEPSIVVRTGNGVHAYWLLDRNLTTVDEREAQAGILPGFYAVFGGDHVQNLSRVMRPPGTRNYKEARNGKSPIPCSLVSYKLKRKYPIAAFAKWMGPTGSSNRHRNEPSAIRVEAMFPPNVGLTCRADSAALASRLELPSEDRSRRDFAVICDLLRLGLSMEEIWKLVADKSKFQSNGRPYFDLTIANAEKTVLLGTCQARASLPAT